MIGTLTRRILDLDGEPRIAVERQLAAPWAVPLSEGWLSERLRALQQRSPARFIEIRRLCGLLDHDDEAHAHAHAHRDDDGGELRALLGDLIECPVCDGHGTASGLPPWADRSPSACPRCGGHGQIPVTHTSTRRSA